MLFAAKTRALWLSAAHRVDNWVFITVSHDSIAKSASVLDVGLLLKAMTLEENQSAVRFEVALCERNAGRKSLSRQSPRGI